MATFTQHNEHNIDWSCLPCIGNNSQSDDRRPYHHQRTKIGIDNDDEMKQTEKLLASELSKLSVQERAEAFDDVHCVGEELKETPELIERSLAEFEQVVQRERSHVYHMAWNQNSAYVEDPSFRLKFLRANMHDVDSSVRQMMHFLQLKATYFGNDKVAREITLDDLDKEDMEVLLSGLWHIQEERDRTGRVIVHMFGNLFGKWKAENTVRLMRVTSGSSRPGSSPLTVCFSLDSSITLYIHERAASRSNGRKAWWCVSLSQCDEKRGEASIFRNKLFADGERCCNVVSDPLLCSALLSNDK